ncbi:MAG: class I mannose-6-phosphate isomerase [Sphingomonadales bacterium]|nr:class I mannose-6-phosphate isomerase [Sphingomonadales bacterium]
MTETSALLPIRMVEKPWGQTRLPAPFATPPGQVIGEIWFEPPADLAALLVKYIFTSEALSVQVHPSDAQTRAAGKGNQGKEECWLVIAAEPGARIGIGFDRALDGAAMRAAALDGSIEHLMTWHAVTPGDFFFIPANTVHAIGGGIALIEIQQNSDITYRLYDYGRPRELHLDEGIAVARGEPYPESLHRRVAADETATLVDGPHFRMDRVAGPMNDALRERYATGPLLAIPLAGAVSVAGQPVPAGACARAARVADITIQPGATCLLAQPVDQTR